MVSDREAGNMAKVGKALWWVLCQPYVVAKQVGGGWGVLTLWVSIPTFPSALVLIKPYLPFGISNVYNWGIIVIGIIAMLMVIFLVTAVRLKLKMTKPEVGILMTKPEVGILEMQRDGAAYSVPIVNHGPGSVKLFVEAISVTYSVDSEACKRKGAPVRYIRWEDGHGNIPEGEPNCKT